MAQPYQKVELKKFAKAHSVDTSESSFWKKFRVRLRKAIQILHYQKVSILPF